MLLNHEIQLIVNNLPATQTIVAELSPGETDAFTKMLSALNGKGACLDYFLIENSVLSQEHKAGVSIVTADFTPILQHNGNIRFTVSTDTIKKLRSMRGNDQSILIDEIIAQEYRLVNGHLEVALPYYNGVHNPVTPPDIFDDHKIGDDVKITDPSHIYRVIYNSYSVYLFIYYDQLCQVGYSINDKYTFDQNTYAQIRNQNPNLILRADHFLLIRKGIKAILSLAYDGDYWLKTETHLGMDMVITHYEKLTVVSGGV